MKRYLLGLLTLLLGIGLGAGGVGTVFAYTSPFLSLDNSQNQYVQILDGDQDGLDITGDMTVECWVLSTGIQDTKTYFVAAKDGSDPQRSFGVGINNTSGVYSAAMFNSSDGTNGGTVANQLIALPTFSTSTWHHLAWVYDASRGGYEVFLDGSSVGSTTGLKKSIYNSSAPFSIGGSSDAVLGGSTWGGYLDSCRVWNKKRSATQIVNKMNELVLPDAVGLVGQWTFKRNFSDTSEYANHMVGINNPHIQN